MLFLVILPLVSSLLAENGFLEALEQASEGKWKQPALVEVSGFYQEKFQNFTFYGNGLGIRDGREQVRLTSKHVTQVFRELSKARFSEMPETFGGKPRPTNGPEVRSIVRVHLGIGAKPSAKCGTASNLRPFAFWWNGCSTLALECLQVLLLPRDGKHSAGWWKESWPQRTLVELALETSPKRFMTFTILDGWYTLAMGDGNVEES